MPDLPFVGEITIAAFNNAPKGFAVCHGQLLPINQNQALFSLLGTTFGGNGQTNFALPDLRGRMPIGVGQGLATSLKTLGEVGGTETVTLLSTQMPSHSHTLTAVNVAGDVSNPGNALLANSGALDKEYKGAPLSAPVAMHASAIGATGGNQPHENMAPFLVLNFYIALQGVFPSQG